LAPGEYGYVGLGWKDKVAGRKVVFGITGSLSAKVPGKLYCDLLSAPNCKQEDEDIPPTLN